MHRGLCGDCSLIRTTPAPVRTASTSSTQSHAPQASGTCPRLTHSSLGRRDLSPSPTSSTIDSTRCGSSPIGTFGSFGTAYCSLPGNAAPEFPSLLAGHTQPWSPTARTSRLQTSPTARWPRSTTKSRRPSTSDRATREPADAAGHTTSLGTTQSSSASPRVSLSRSSRSRPATPTRSSPCRGMCGRSVTR
ncbi:hypothetical protein CATRI_04310 [Corynebacterium atrinae]|nr:hypothetical protein CATRI_04310 [Corynebacterium atrinae]